MSDIPTGRPHGGLDGLPGQAAEAAAALSGLKAPAEAAAAAIDSAFAKAGASLARTLGKAASDGKISLGELVSAAIQAAEVFARMSSARGSGGGSGSGLTDALASVLKSTFSGARADGGPVGAGGAYLVGERGPELFRPYASGEIEPAGRGGTVVNVTVQGQGAPALLRSEAQIAAALARAVSLGGR